MRSISRLPIAVLAALASACGSNLAHESPFDPQAPAAKQAKARVTGHVLLAGETDHSQITVLLKGAERTYTTQTLDDGSVELAGVVPGTYALAIFTRYFEPVSETAVVTLGETLDLGERTLAPKTAAVTGSALVGKLDGTELTTTGGVTLTLTKTASIRGGAAAAPQGFFGLTAAAPVTVTTRSSSTGDFSFDGVPAGKYTMRADNPDGPSVSVDVNVTGENGSVKVDPIVLEPLTGFFTITGTPAGDYTRTADVELAISGFQAARMQIGSSATGRAPGCAFGAAVPYAALRTFTLPADGLNTVCVKFIDKDGNESAPVLRTITLDRLKPAGSVSIDNGAAYTSDPAGEVTLTFNATSTYAAVDSLKVAALTAGTCAAALAATTSIAYVASQSIFLAPAGAGVEGTRTVCAAFGSAAGNWSDPVEDTIRYDLRAPAGSLTLAASVTNDTRLALSLAYDADTTAMRLGAGSSCNSGVWSEPAAAAYWSLAAQDGAQQVSVQYRDAAGNTSDCIVRTVTLDRTGPAAGSFNVTGNGVQPNYSRQRQVSVSASTPAPDCARAELSEDAGFALNVQTAATCSLASTAFTLDDREGLHTVYLRYTDALGNVGPSSSATIILDTAAPTATLSLNNGAAYATDLAGNVNARLTATAANSPLDRMKVANLTSGTCDAALTAAAVQPLQNNFAWTLAGPGDGVEGERYVCVSVRNLAGAWSAAVSDSVTYDRKAPTGGLTLAASVTNDTRLTVALTYSAEATAMKLAGDPACGTGQWVESAAAVNWNLQGQDGVQPVSVQYRDAAGNVSACYSRTIKLDRAGPVPGAFTVAGNGAQPLYSRQVTVAVSIQTPDADCAHLDLSEDSGFAFGVATFATCTLTGQSFVLETRQGLHQVYARFTDALGNVGPAVAASVIVDTVTPTLALAVDGGAAFTTSLAGNVTLQLTAAAANTQLDQMKVANLTAGTCATALASATAVPYQASYAWTLASPGNGVEGTRTVCAAVRNQAGAWSAAASDTIAYDRANPTGTLAFNAPVTRDTLAVLTLTYAADVKSMKLSAGNACAGGQWLDAATSTVWTLVNLDGAQWASVQFRDGAGNESGCVTASTTLDTTGPVAAGFAITGSGIDPAYSNTITLAVSLASTAPDCTGAEFAEDPGFAFVTAAVPACALTNEPYELLNTAQGVRNVYARFVDTLGNRGPVAVAAVVYDSIAPQGASLAIDKGALTRDPAIALLVAASGADQLSLDAGPACTGASWSAFRTSVAQALPGTDGDYLFSVRMRDWAGNTSACLTQSIRLDQTVSLFAVDVTGADGGTTATLSQLVDVSLTGLDADVVEMKVSNLQNLGDAAWVTIDAGFSWLLQAGDGARTVYVRVRDTAGNERDAAATITLDQTPPAAPVLAAADNDGDGFALASGHVELTWSSSAVADLKGYRLERLISGAGNTFQVVAASLPATATAFTDTASGLDGKTLYYRIRAEDQLGNVSAYSNLAAAEVFAPVAAAQIVHRGGTTTAKFKVPQGVFSVQTDRSWVTKDLVTVTQALAANKFEFELPPAPAGVWNDSLRVRMLNRNQDLAYEQTIFLDDRRLVQVNAGVTPQACSYYSLDVDARGEPHMQWVNQSSGLEVRYASYTSQETFTNTVIGTQNQTQIELRVDPAGRSHMIWKETHGGWDTVHYARVETDGTRFDAVVPSLIGSPVYYAQMDVDDTGRAHLVFYGNSYGFQYSRIGAHETTFENGYMNHWAHIPEIRVAGHSLYIVGHAGYGWDIPVIWKDNLDDLALDPWGYWNFDGTSFWLPDNMINEEVSLEPDELGRLHWISSVPGKLQQMVMTPGVGWGSVDDLAAQGLPLASGTTEFGPLTSDGEAVAKDGGDLWIKQGGVWRRYTELAGLFQNNSKNGRVIRDAADRLHMAACGYDGRLWYARFPASEIFPTKISDDVGAGDTGFAHALAVGAGDLPHVLYTNRTMNTVEYAHLDAGGSWTTEVVEAGTGELAGGLPDYRLGYHMAIALGVTGAVHAVYEAESAGAYPNVHYAVRDPFSGAWSITNLGTGYHPSITAAAGRVAIAYVPPQPWWHPVVIHEGPEFGPFTDIDTGMDIEDNSAYGWVGSNNYVMRHPNVQYDTSGHLHVAAAAEMFGNGYYQALRYATNRSGAWVHQRYDPCCFHGHWPSVGVTDGSKAYVTHFAFGENFVYLTTFNNDTGMADTVPMGGRDRGGLSTLVMDKLGLPNIALIDYAGDRLLFDFFDGTQWTESPVRTFATDLIVTGAGSPWAPAPPGDNEFGLRHRLAVDSQNRVHETYYDVDRGKLVYLYPVTHQHALPALQTRLVPPF